MYCRYLAEGCNHPNFLEGKYSWRPKKPAPAPTKRADGGETKRGSLSRQFREMSALGQQKARAESRWGLGHAAARSNRSTLTASDGDLGS